MFNIFEATVNVIKKNKTGVDRGLRTLNAELEHEATVVMDTPKSIVQRVVKVYRGVKPLLTVLSTLPILPSTWRGGIVIFIQVLDGLAAIDISAAFKAGRDLEPAA